MASLSTGQRQHGDIYFGAQDQRGVLHQQRLHCLHRNAGRSPGRPDSHCRGTPRGKPRRDIPASNCSTAGRVRFRERAIVVHRRHCSIELRTGMMPTSAEAVLRPGLQPVEHADLRLAREQGRSCMASLRWATKKRRQPLREWVLATRSLNPKALALPQQPRARGPTGQSSNIQWLPISCSSGADLGRRSS